MDISFICSSCEQTRLAVDMLPGRVVPVECRHCGQKYEVKKTSPNTTIIVKVGPARANAVAVV